jgi:long-chain-alcohol oxidase
MLAIADAIVPHLEGPDAAKIVASLPQTASQRQKELVAEFARDGFIDHPHLMDCLAHQASKSLSKATLGDINLLLSILSTRAGTLAFTGHIGPYATLDRKTREGIVAKWATSPLSMLQKAAAGFKGLVLIVFYRFHQPAWEAVGYSEGPAEDWSSAAKEEEQVEHYPYVFENDKIAVQSSNSEIVLDTDVLVIGSGSGGGIVASYLAQRGVRVLVAEKGTYIRPNDMKGREDQGYADMYEGEGLYPTEDGSINVLAGSTFGGGTTVNWSASLKPRHYLRESWANTHGLPYFRSPLFSDDLNAVTQRMGCSTTAIKHNIANSLLALGAQRAGHPVEAVPQNSGGHVHYCGKCHLGCISGHKQGGIVTWLKDAAESGNGAFVVNCSIERILFDETKRRAIGALAVVDGRKVTIRANRSVVVCGGSIQTPAILLRSPELKYNTQIGQHLHLHPTTTITGFYDFPIKPWEGSLLTMVSNAAELIDHEGWGCKIEVIASSPSIHAAFSNFESAEAHKADMLRYAHSFEIIVIARDREGGSVFVDKDGKARMNYTISKHDRHSLLQGVLKACDIHMMAGASKIGTVQVGMKPFKPTLSEQFSPSTSKTLPETTTIPSTATPVEAVPRNLSDPKYVEWRNAVEKLGSAPYWMTTGSAHQMGSCRLGSSPKTSALDPQGRVWGAKNLWVAGE